MKPSARVFAQGRNGHFPFRNPDLLRVNLHLDGASRLVIGGIKTFLNLVKGEPVSDHLLEWRFTSRHQVNGDFVVMVSVDNTVAC